jgi:UDP-2-acetamido-3-amino-2,3-dideoxy-glucuronate N-acetyltransferase
LKSKPAVKVAVVGCGAWGKNHLRVFDSLGALCMACDEDEGKLYEVHKAYPDVRCTPYFKTVLKSSVVRGVVIATPSQEHYRMALEALEAGKDVLVEKPLALRYKEGEALVRLAAKRERLLMVGHILLFHPAVEKMKALLAEGAVGEVEYLYSNRLNFGKVRTEESALWSFAPHDLAAFLYLLGKLPREVTTTGGAYLQPRVADVTVTNLEFAEGVRAHLYVSWLHPFKEQRMVLVGDKGMLVFDDLAKDRLVLFQRRLDRTDGGWVAHKPEGKPVQVSSEEPLLREDRHFLDCIARRRKPRSDGESALAVLKILEASQRSLEARGRPVALAEVFGEPRGYFVHETARVDEPAEIGEGTKIWHYSHVLAGARIGKNCVLGQNVNVGGKAVIGDFVKLQNNVSVYDGVILEDYVFCGPSLVFTNVINPRSAFPRKNEFQTTRVRTGATLGANATVLCGVTIGKHAFVGAGAVVTRDIPDYALVLGNPAKFHSWICACGVHLPEGKAPRCPSCARKYRMKGQNISEM